MPTILSLSSQVARGLVGQAVNGFVWQRLGFDVTLLPTVVLSNRPDYPHCAGERLSAERLDAMFQALEQNGFLQDIAAIFTGYLPSAEHVSLAARWIERLKADSPGLVYCCDPIFGDEPDGLYVAEEAAASLRDTLVPMADILTPNRFELGWLTGAEIATQDDAVVAARRLGPLVLATSSPCDRPDELANLAVSAGDAWRAVSAFREHVPHGTGDLTAALFLAHYLRGASLQETLALTAGALESVIAASVGRQDLALIAEQDRWASAGPGPVERIPAGGQ
jgi:pyridoxine kinase